MLGVDGLEVAYGPVRALRGRVSGPTRALRLQAGLLGLAEVLLSVVVGVEVDTAGQGQQQARQRHQVTAPGPPPRGTKAAAGGGTPPLNSRHGNPGEPAR